MRTPKPGTDATVAARKLPPATLKPSELPMWEVSYGSEATGWTTIGWVEERALRGAKNRFYFATGIHPATGKHYSLEGSTDFDDRVNVIADFNLDPMTSRQHLGLGTYSDHPN